MSVIYNTQAFDKSELMQGDVLERTEALDALLKQVHPHFFNSKNLYFQVLTQSCDLALHDKGKCNAPYISLAPVRSLDWLLKKHIAALSSPKVLAELPVVANKNREKTRQFLQRLINNNEAGYFFLDETGGPLSENSVAVLRLTIAIKADLHYQDCLDSKIIQLNDNFQSKLGWLVGQQYSRVGTEDFPPDYVNEKIKALISDMAIWVEDRKLKEIEEAYRVSLTSLSACHGSNASKRIIKAEEISRAVKALPNPKQTILEEVMRVVKLSADPEVAEKIRQKLVSDAGLNSLLGNNSLLDDP